MSLDLLSVALLRKVLGCLEIARIILGPDPCFTATIKLLLQSRLPPPISTSEKSGLCS